LTPHSPGTGQINTLIWIGFFAALIVVLAINLGLFGAIRRNRGGRGHTATQPRGAVGLQWRVTGVLSGFAVLLFVLGIIFTSNATSTPKTTSEGLTSYHGEKLEGPLVVKVTGQQWIWRYNYPNGSFSYYKMVIPVHSEIEMKLTSTDVVHTWNVPDLTPKVDAVPGKDTKVYFRADTEGEFVGQSSTLSGQAYAPMRIAVEVVSPERFEEFIAEQAKDIRKGDEAAEEIENEKVAEEAEFEKATEGEESGSEGEESAAAGGAPDAAAGKEVFATNCAACHGETGHGGAGGPDLTTMPKAQEQASAEEQVTDGGGGMPPFKGTLSEEEISNVAAYVVEDIVGK
jgi:heme/copper-type cytochrome/quinol oxidase subunit 2